MSASDVEQVLELCIRNHASDQCKGTQARCQIDGDKPGVCMAKATATAVIQGMMRCNFMKAVCDVQSSLQQ